MVCTRESMVWLKFGCGPLGTSGCASVGGIMTTNLATSAKAYNIRSHKMLKTVIVLTFPSIFCPECGTIVCGLTSCILPSQTCVGPGEETGTMAHVQDSIRSNFGKNYGKLGDA